MTVQQSAAMAAHRVRCNAFLPSPALHPLDCRTLADAENFGRRTRRYSTLNIPNQTDTQILGIGSCHQRPRIRCRPQNRPTARRWESLSESDHSKTALVEVAIRLDAGKGYFTSFCIKQFNGFRRSSS